MKNLQIFEKNLLKKIKRKLNIKYFS